MKEFLNKMKSYFPNLQIDALKSSFIPRWKVSLLKNTENVNDTSLCDDIYYGKGYRDQFLNPIHLEIKQNKRTTDESHFQVIQIY